MNYRIKQTYAFPVNVDLGFQGVKTYLGMTLRDWFAGQALSGMMANKSFTNGNWDDLVSSAYGIADDMLRERAMTEADE